MHRIFIAALLIMLCLPHSALAQTIGTPQYNCIYNYVYNLGPNEPRNARLHAMARKRGDTSAAGYDALRHTRDFVSVNHEAKRACRGVR
jgi:hypothetical protein